MLRSRTAIIFDLIIIKKKTNAEHSSSHASTINFYKNVNTRFHAIFFFNILLLFTIKRKRNKGGRNNNSNNYNNNNNNNNNESNESESDKSDKSDKNKKSRNGSRKRR